MCGNYGMEKFVPAKPGARFIPNAGGGSLYLLDMCRIGELADTLFADQQGRHGINAYLVNSVKMRKNIGQPWKEANRRYF